jgi:DNA-binding transcriptional regulator YiaG
MTNIPWDGELIRAARKKHGLNQEELAALLGCRQQTVSEWEIGVYAPGNAYQRIITQVFQELDSRWVQSE